ncbi:MAG TPA: ATP-binding cassette domain-containing protein [Desulfuromonadales bacterium]|nr:ATP-binding cassette domain-containing protein [Desulfuromonadales bacterium]
MSESILKLEQVSYRYPDGTCALDRCSLQIGTGSRTAVLGANGAGKTTLFLHLNGILRPAAGQVCWHGTPLEYSRSGLRELRSRVGLVFQNPDSQLFSASVREDVSFGPLNLGLSEAAVCELVGQALQAVGMAEFTDKPVHNLSFGQKKRVCIAGVLAMQPDVVVLDEPMAGLDASVQRELLHVLDTLYTNGMTIVIATHDLDFAYGWADQVIVLQSGRLLAQGRPEVVLEHPDVAEELGALPFVAELTRHLALNGIDLCDKGYQPRSRHDLLTALGARSNQEEKP